jgi:hypothetical protein
MHRFGIYGRERSGFLLVSGRPKVSGTSNHVVGTPDPVLLGDPSDLGGGEVPVEMKRHTWKGAEK